MIRNAYLGFIVFIMATVYFSGSGVDSDTPAPSTQIVRGVDVSHFSGKVNWPRVMSAGIAFAYAKATEGNDYVDPTFTRHWSDMKDAGIPRGAYHFFIIDDAPHTQAANFINNVPALPGDLPPVVDVEHVGKKPDPDRIAELRTWLEIVEEHYGVKPMIYTSINFWNKNLDDEFADFPLWIAHYGDEEPQLPEGWSQWRMWQYTQAGNIDGIEKIVDISYLKDLPGLLNDPK